MSVIFLFADGVGIGDDVPHNPFSMGDFRIFQRLTGQERMVCGADVGALDAGLGVGGFPQSGTGQVTLFSGVNAAALIGQHFGPYPHSKIRHLLTDGSSLFQRAASAGRRCVFLNAYPERFFTAMEARNRWSATTRMALSAGQRLHTVEDIRAGRGITAEILQDYWRQHLYPDVPSITVEESADRVMRAASDHDLVLTEYYLTDKAGHAMDADVAKQAIRRFDDFACAVLDRLGPDDTLLITSDHGNVEDLSVKTHTTNAVPLLVGGKEVGGAPRSGSLADVTPLILGWMRADAP
jgi:hypothetical protein